MTVPMEQLDQAERSALAEALARVTETQVIAQTAAEMMQCARAAYVTAWGDVALRYALGDGDQVDTRTGTITRGATA